MMESVEVGVRNGRIGGRCEMCTERAFSVQTWSKFSAKALQFSQPALQHCVTFENGIMLSAILGTLEVSCEYDLFGRTVLLTG